MSRVGIVVPVYNREHFIVDCLQSIEKQTFKDWDVWVIDDGSADRTIEIVGSLNLPQLHLLQVEHGQQAKARNAALMQIDSEFVAFLDSDDLWEPYKLEKQMPLFTDRPQVGLVYSDAYRLDEDGPQKLTTHQLRAPRRGRVFHSLCLQPNFVVTSTVVVRRQCIKEVGLFEPAFVPSEDFHMWLRVAAQYEFDYVREPLAWYRFHRGQSLKKDVPGNYLRHIAAMQSVEGLYPELVASIYRPMHQYMAFLAYMAGRVALSDRNYGTAHNAFALSMKTAWNWRASVFLLLTLLFTLWNKERYRR